MTLLSLDNIPAMQSEVRTLAAERGAVILAHNYQLPEIQEVADYVGDSLGLSQRAAASDAEVIAFCGVHFMAETASILCPEKTVLIPDADAGCSLADSITAEQLSEWRAAHPGAEVLTYMTTTAPGCLAFQARSWSAVIESASEQPAPRSGSRTVFSGDRIFAVSAMKCTPQKTIASSPVAAAWRERPSESPT